VLGAPVESRLRIFLLLKGYGHGLPLVYAMWILVVVVLFLPCRWFMQVKARTEIGHG